ncbi:LysM peptidoglycan-binding domain-containing protein [Pigmentibacter sp. JX0631]|uniref:LysM peptidoglycan-binding domain-containing protein n=1 Tax=Pigmentibacter sp. JX0631 TaxID=2976982 RepID=UPI002468CD32|nr:LysM peptidoglycan-binding domain-containing protein [Pigmentibacter sp. JX0631]WGL61449.1 LysM peptidoglycan-binding domain-containing protein [Pigmentibacter sp. JX0631]
MITRFMQKMAEKNKKLVFLISIVILSLSVFSCMTRSGQIEDQNVNEAKLDVLDNKDNPDFAEGLLPPTNQNILLPYYVQAGDNLAKISKKIYGKASNWKKIAELNKLSDANRIYAGDVIYYQLSSDSKMFAEKYESAPKAKIIVKRGDTLTSISRAVFGKAKDWRVLWKENPHIVNPDRIKEGVAVYFRPKALTADIKGYGIPEQKAKASDQVASEDKKENTVSVKETENPKDKVEDKNKGNINNSNSLSEEDLKAIQSGTSENFVHPEDNPKERNDE